MHRMKDTYLGLVFPGGVAGVHYFCNKGPEAQPWFPVVDDVSWFSWSSRMVSLDLAGRATDAVFTPRYTNAPGAASPRTGSSAR